MAAAYTLKKLTDVKDSAPDFGIGEFQQTHFATDDLEAEHTGFTFHHINPDARPPFAHRHQAAAEVYVVLAGSGRAKLDDEIFECKASDAVRVAPDVVRCSEGGPNGAELVVFGAPKADKDTELIEDWWTG